MAGRHFRAAWLLMSFGLSVANANAQRTRGR
jgi:hypothetical protein